MSLVSAGVDVGSVSSQAVIVCDGEVVACSNLPTGASSPGSANRAMGRALEDGDLQLDDLHFVVATGYGRVNVPFAHRTLTEIQCHARGARFIYGDTVRTVLDVGGQDCKAIRCNERGKVVAFQLNDKCAAGTGRGMETFAELLQVPIKQVGPLSLSVEHEPPPISNVCVVHAKREALKLLREGRPKEIVLAAYCGAMARRVRSLLDKVGVEATFAITGGIAKNAGVVARLEDELGLEAARGDIDPQLAGALGAALLGQKLARKKRRKG